ncbi:Serine/threonine protein phosphatase [Neorhizobium galegae bv. officinalis bv. officinalis str. HAMBI 1141]|uniref:Serine/threonine protein phosphatase n=1 Tax=Neorhizobium galegae bv. officinalis bv. officinalis str. HAMBI 1141 TaxID=1028801 RepID=A0A068T5P2_NEOGA|nr:metallophosphoesterase [Neorhizobium galegae]CDN53832.1 Serine/threonine protein phosphatase [Neorhizobium galegae bv. officinalis bv. officinalis str. HAMBI 1141]
MNKKNLIAVGDIHGMAHVLKLLLQHLEKKFSADDTQFVFLGDIIDRGPDSLPAVNQVCRVIDTFPGSVMVLGNHDFFLRHMADLSLAKDEEDKWLAQGGMNTLESYGLDEGDLVAAGKALRRIRPRHVALFENAVSHFETEKHFFVHAGVDPEVSLSDQLAHDLMWIRKGFLDHTAPLEKMIVHGHSITPSELPEVHPNRIAIDTGSYRTGRITAAIFCDDFLHGFISAEINGDGKRVRRFDASAQEVENLQAA